MMSNKVMNNIKIAVVQYNLNKKANLDSFKV
jgi:hypothetical protein